jgi:hypothetical protein
LRILGQPCEFYLADARRPLTSGEPAAAAGRAAARVHPCGPAGRGAPDRASPNSMGPASFGLAIGIFGDLVYGVLLLNAILGGKFLRVALSRPQAGRAGWRHAGAQRAHRQHLPGALDGAGTVVIPPPLRLAVYPLAIFLDRRPRVTAPAVRSHTGSGCRRTRARRAGPGRLHHSD